VREKHCWLVADKPDEHGVNIYFLQLSISPPNIIYYKYNIKVSNKSFTCSAFNHQFSFVFRTTTYERESREKQNNPAKHPTMNVRLPNTRYTKREQMKWEGGNRRSGINKPAFGCWLWGLVFGIGICSHECHRLDVQGIDEWNYNRMLHDIPPTCMYPPSIQKLNTPYCSASAPAVCSVEENGRAPDTPTKIHRHPTIGALLHSSAA
jgi:hypothetical protein